MGHSGKSDRLDSCWKDVRRDVNLKLDPFERFHEARGYDKWSENRTWLFAPINDVMMDFVKSLKDYPPRARSADLDVDELMKGIGDPTTRQPRKIATFLSGPCILLSVK